MGNKAYIVGGTLTAVLIIVAVLMVRGPGEVQLTEADNGSTIELKSGQALSITLEANPTTGYTWEVVESPDEQVMRQVGKIEFKPESEAIGAGGVQIIRFEVVNAGQTNLTLIYHRPWETDVEPLKTFALHVVAR
jgi:inhibitor of cysteine peptidase